MNDSIPQLTRWNAFFHYTCGVNLVKVKVPPESAGERLDRFLAKHAPELSRTRVQELVEEGRVRVNGAAVKPSHRVQNGEEVEAELAPRPPLRAVAEAIPLDVLYEDDDVVVVNKPAGMVVHAGAARGSQRSTLVNALLGRYSQLSSGSEASGLRPGIVHRLDKETSGCIVVARNDAAHALLAGQFQSRRVDKIYLALVHGRLQGRGRIDLPIARDLKRRTRMIARAKTGTGRAALTEWRALIQLEAPSEKKHRGRGAETLTLAEVTLHTGRTHQIRAHFAALRHPVVGDELYGAPRNVVLGRETLPPLGRNFLHAARIRFSHPRTGEPVSVRAKLPSELTCYLKQAAKACGFAFEQIDAAASSYL